MASLYDRISQGTMTVDEITESMRHATSEGGKFFQSMEKQSQTLNGQLATLKDNADQLLGSLTEGLSEGLRTELLPLANNLVAELQTAFDTGGYQALVDKATGMLPDLLNMMTGELQKAITGLSRWLPQGATQLMKALPAALRGASAVVPEITTALFEISSVIITDLIGMLPELVPALAEGLVNTFTSALKGVYTAISGVYKGIEQMIHQGQTKIAGVWVDDAAIAEYTFDLTTNTEPAETAIEGAYSNIRAALATDLLTDSQEEEIEGMIGADYDAIKAKLLSFGLSEQEAAPIATAISSAGDTIRAEIDKLNLGVDSGTVLKWISQANGSRIILKSILESTALSPEEQDAVVGVFTNMTDNINGQLPDVVSEIYDTLTNGNAEDDDPKSLKEKLDEAFGADIAEVELWLQEKIGALDTESDTYESDVAALTAQAGAYKTEIELLHAQMAMLVDTLAGQPTEVVKARMAEFAEIEARLAEINAEIDATSAKALSAEEAAFQVVRSGAQADAATISQAISFKVKEFKLDEQSAEDEYDATVQQLNMQLANGEIGEIQFNARINTEISQLEDSKAEAQTRYEEALGQIFRGIAESEGIEQAVADAANKANFADALNALVVTMANQSGPVGDSLGEELTAIISEGLNIPASAIESMDYVDLMFAIRDWAGEVYEDAAKEIEKTDNSKLQEAYAAALESGVLEGTEFDTTDQAAQFKAILGLAMTEGAALAAPEAQSAGETMVDNAETGAGDSGTTGTSLGGDFGSGYVQGILAWVTAAYFAAYTVVQSAARGAAAGQKSNSPSKVAMGLGRDFGEGYTIGLQESMAHAAEVARMMTGHVATSVDIIQATRVSNMPNLQQEIILANEQSQQPINLYVNGRELARVTAGDTQQAQNWHNRRIALGVGK